MIQTAKTAKTTKTTKKPRCTSNRHRWTDDHAIVGGIATNPGVWGTWGIDWLKVEACVHCGCGRHTAHTHDGHQWSERVSYVPGEFKAESAE